MRKSNWKVLYKTQAAGETILVEIDHMELEMLIRKARGATMKKAKAGPIRVQIQWCARRFTVSELAYASACKLIEDCNLAGINATIVSGGLALYPSSLDKELKMMTICAKYGVVPSTTPTHHESVILSRAQA